MKKCTIKLIWNDGIWYTKPVGELGFGFTLEHGSFDALIERVKIAIPEMLEESCGYKGEIEITFETERVDKLKALTNKKFNRFEEVNMDYVYHGSPIGGLTYLEPRRSTHGKSWVYATKNKSAAIIHSQKWNDYIFNESFNNCVSLELTERLPNALEEIYKGKKGYLYYLDSANFIEGQTSFTEEVVSEKTEQILKCEVIEDTYVKLCEMNERKEIILYRYPDRPDYIPIDDSDLIRKTKLILERSQDKRGLIEYVIEKHPKLKDALVSLY